MAKVVIIEDDESMASALGKLLSERGHEVRLYLDPPPLDELEQSDPQVLLIDCILQTTSGMDYLRLVRKKAGLARVPIIFMTGIPELAEELKAINDPRCAVLAKPFTAEVVLATTGAMLTAA